MKKLILISLIIVLNQSLANAQDTEFKVSESGLTDFIIVPVDSMKAADSYRKCVEWIGKTYNNPESVIKSKIEGSSIRIEGSADNLIYGPGLSGLSKYQVEISFRDGRYKFDVLKIEGYVNPSIGWIEIPQKGDWGVYYKDGQLKKSGLFVNGIPVYFNNLNSGLKDYILNISKSETDKW
jgi:hypothetical protein